jgi:hypothetical protein
LLTRDLRCIAARELLGSMAFRTLPREPELADDRS